MEHITCPGSYLLPIFTSQEGSYTSFLRYKQIICVFVGLTHMLVGQKGVFLRYQEAVKHHVGHIRVKGTAVQNIPFVLSGQH